MDACQGQNIVCKLPVSCQVILLALYVSAGDSGFLSNYAITLRDPLTGTCKD